MRHYRHHRAPMPDVFEGRHALHLLATRRLGLRTMIRRYAGDLEVAARSLGMKQCCAACQQLTCTCSDSAYLGWPVERLEQRQAIRLWASEQESLDEQIDAIPIEARCKTCLISICDCDDFSFLGIALTADECRLIGKQAA